MTSYSYSGEEKLLAVISHASALCMPIVLPLIIYLLKKDSTFVRNHTKEALVFHLSMMIALFISGMLTIILVGFLLIAFFFTLYTVCTIIAIIRSINGEPYQYPVTKNWAEKL